MNLADWLKRSHPVGEQVAMVAALAQAVEEGHGRGIQYAGWSPSRIQIQGGGSVDLSALDAGENPKEDLAYTAPEAVEGSHSTRSDVYSAGVILYEILAGNHPFSGLSVKQPRGAPKPLGDVRRDVPKDLADAVTACLERDPEWRPADLSYVLRVAQEAGAKPSRSAPAAAPAAPSRGSTGRVPISGGGRRDAGPLSTPRGGDSSTRLPMILIGLVLLGGGAAGGYFFLMKRGENTSTPPPTTVATAPAPTAESTPAVTEAATAAPVRPAGTPLPAVTDRRPTAVATVATTAPTEAPTATRLVAAVTAAPTATRTATATPIVTAAPTTAPTQAPTAAPAMEPASLKAVAPPKLKRGQQLLLDVRGANLRADLRARFQHKGKDASGDLVVARQRAVDGALLQVLVVVSANAPTGAYTLALIDADGSATNAIPFEVTQ